MQFLCDQMLARLGRWLRAAGYDTAIITSAIDDREIFQMAVKESRILLTRDKHFLEMRAPGSKVLFFSSNSLHGCVEELNHAIKLDWLLAPFSRCLLCNSLLTEPDARAIAEQVPPKAGTHSKHFYYCPQCKKVFWEGSHTKRMLKQLQRWQSSSIKR